MGRPINKKFFGNTNSPGDDAQTGGPTGTGGEGIASVIVGATGTNYSSGATLTFSSPALPGGTTATGTLVVAPGVGGITGVNIVTEGNGYTSTATLTITTATGVNVAGTGTNGLTTIFVTTSGLFTGMTVTGTGVGTNAKVAGIGSGSITASVANAGTVSGTLSFRDFGSGARFTSVLTDSQQNGIIIFAYVPGGSSGVIGDIMKQEASRRYLVRTAQGQGQCILVTTSTLAAGEMYMTATDVRGNSYFVDKLTARRARLSRFTLTTGTFEYVTGDVTSWSLSAATTGTVQITNA